MMSTAPYGKYKDSGVEWLGAVPEHWEVKSIKYVARIVSGSTPKSDISEFWGGIISWATPEDIGRLNGIYLTETKRTITKAGYESCGTELLSGRSIVLTTRAPIGNLAIAAKPMCTNQGCKSLVPTSDMSSEFLYYRLNTLAGVLQSRGRGSTFLELSTPDLSAFRIAVPPLAEQRAIASYLDRETARLDRLVSRQERLIELSLEKRRALIGHAVTRGLDEAAPRQASGVEWLGDVPAHWEVKKLRYLVSLKSGEGITSERIEADGEYPVYGGNGLRGYTTDFTHSGHYALIGRQGALCGNINYASGKFWASEHAVVVNPLCEFETVWMGELLRAMNLNQYSVSAAQPGLSVEAISVLKIPVPPLSEQRAIVSYLDAETARLDRLMGRARRAVELMKERRGALIAAAVTGQMDVRAA